MDLTVKKKTGFKSKSPLVVIYKGHFPFYANSEKQTLLTFNLPPGKYDVVVGNIYPMANPVEYKRAPYLVTFAGKYVPSDFETIWCKNPNKLSVDTVLRKIYIDFSFKDKNPLGLIWALGHELGHVNFKGKGQLSEKDCDTFGANLMLIWGYNPSQIKAAQRMALSSNFLAKCRHSNLDKQLRKTY